jgi:hypothetical protein
VAQDFNADGIQDVTVANDYDHAFSVLFGLPSDAGTASGAFGPPQPYVLSSGLVESLALGDFNLDGRIDIAAPDNVQHVAVFMASPGDMGAAGGFSYEASYRVGGRGDWFVATGDFNGDGKPDLVTANFTDSTVGVLLNDRP